jgi:glycosyltransferase involved in cell wall biosynthesis
MRRILYDLTYADRGKSGIPRDSRTLGKILGSLRDYELNCVTSSTEYVPRKLKLEKQEVKTIATYRFRANFFRRQGLHFFAKMKSLSYFLLQAFNPMRNVSLIKVTTSNKQEILTRMQLNSIEGINSLFVFGISYPARFISPIWYPLHRINTNQYDFFIQQHIDPIRVEKNTIHIVRLHDILPITNPEYFSKIARKAFSNSLKKMLKNKEIIWVMDTNANADQFRKLFGADRRVEVIPCVVIGPSGNEVFKIKSKEKKYLSVNTIEPRKNIGLVIRSFLVAKNYGFVERSSKLIIAGTYGWLEEILIEELRKGKFGADVVFIESPDESDLMELYSQSHFLISASAAEGFGLPPLEGMSFGCVPIVSDIDQHRETIGDRGIYFDLNEKSLIAALKEAEEKTAQFAFDIQGELSQYVGSKFSLATVANQWEKLLLDIDSRAKS